MEQQEPRKLFQTISLEERLKNSRYNEVSETTNEPADKSKTSPSIAESQSPANKAKTTPEVPPSASPANKKDTAPKLKITSTPTPKVAAQLKIRGDAKEQNIEILKTLVKKRNTQEIPLPRLMKSSPLSSFFRPGARTQFSQTLRLEDRLKQQETTTTRHLPQYFLSDLYTGYLTISKFRTTPLVSTTILDRFNPDIVQGGEEPTEALGQDPNLARMGTFFINGEFVSRYEVSKATDTTTVLIGQGTIFTNGQFISTTRPDSVKPIIEINQGSIELPKYETTPNQGPGIDPFTPLEIGQIAVLQGLILNSTTGEAVDSILEVGEFTTPPVVEPAEAPIKFEFKQEDATGYALPQPETVRIRRDKNRAFLEPDLKHGVANLQTGQFLDDKELAINAPVEKHGTALINIGGVPGENTIAYQTIAPILQNLAQNTAALSGQILGYGDVGTPFELNDADKPAQTPAIDPDQVFDPLKSGPIANAMGPGGEGNLGSLINRYKSVTNGPIAGYTPVPYKTNKPPNNIVARPKGDQDNPDKGGEDFITLKIHNVANGKAIQYKAYLTALSENWSATWSDIQYVGRQDTLKQFQGVAHTLSFGVLLPALSKADLPANIQKLNKTINTTMMASITDGGKYLQGPLCQITLGKFFNKQYCVFDSMKIDTDLEAGWDIDKELPFVMKVDFSCVLLGDAGGKLHDGKTSKNYAV